MEAELVVYAALLLSGLTFVACLYVSDTNEDMLMPTVFYSCRKTHHEKCDQYVVDQNDVIQEECTCFCHSEKGPSEQE